MENDDIEVIQINIHGEDKPGLTSSLTDILARYDAAILDIGQANIHQTLSMGILFKTDSIRSGDIMKDLLFKAYELGIQIRFQPITVEQYEQWVGMQGKNRYIITMLGRKLTAQQIAAVTRVVAEQGLNIDSILRLTGRVSLDENARAPKSCIELSVRGNPHDKEGMQSRFLQLSTELGMDISFQKDDMFRRSRRLICFDMDSTLIETEVIDELAERAGVGAEVRAITESAMRGEIDFDDVSFTYPDGGEEVLTHFSLHVPAGSTVAIVGETGAGKSTLVNLVCRFFEPTGGRVLIDGRDARERSQLWLHSHVGYVLQSPHLFSGTIRENIRYGRPEATDEEVYEAARAVSADRVAAKLEQGYDTDVGECGDKLSTGEKQLISFARAVIARPKIFVLDEATSSVDTETEMLIQKATHTLMQGTTSFVIAHRLSTIRQADVILVIDHGKIVEQGTHERLLKAGGAYAALYHTQLSRQE